MSDDKTVTQMYLPHKPVGAYIRFKADELGNKWEMLADVEKQKFFDAYNTDKAAGVKRPRPAYFRFVDEQDLSRKWKELDNVIKQKYASDFAKDQKAYREAMKQYDEIYANKVSLAPPLKTKPVLTPSFYYCREMKTKNANSHEGKTKKEINSELQQAWNKLSAEEQQPYKEIVAQEQQKYQDYFKQYEMEWGDVKYIKEKRKENESEEKEDAEDEDVEEEEEEEADVEEKDAQEEQQEDAEKEREEQQEEQEEEQEQEEEEESPTEDEEQNEASEEIESVNEEIVDDASPVEESDLLKTPSKKRPAKQPIKRKLARRSESSNDLATQKAKDEKDLEKAFAAYGHHMLENELNKFTKKALYGNWNPIPTFECMSVWSDINKRWENLSDRTKKNWINKSKVTRRLSNSDDDYADIATPDDEDEDDGVDLDEESNEQDDDDDESSGEDSAQPVLEDDKEGNVISLENEEDEDSRGNDIKNYGDDGDDFVCGDDEIEYEDGMTSEDIRESQKKERVLHEAYSSMLN